MLRLSVNVLTSSIALLKRLQTYRFTSLSELSYSKIASIVAEDVFNFSSVCGWTFENENTLALTPRGTELLSLYDRGFSIELKRDMLLDYLLNAAPIWSNRIPYGRREAAIFMSKDEKACFLDAGLLSENLDEKTVEWWDCVAHQIRSKAQQSKNDIGRSGESNTIKYEKNRTGYEPTWMSIDSNLAGYDVKSKVSKDIPDPLLIEVKASTYELSQATFYITSNEWNVALTSPAYVFHLWCLNNSKKMLAVLVPNDIEPYIPTNNLEGKWESTKIPFLCFENKFVEIE